MPRSYSLRRDTCRYWTRCLYALVFVMALPRSAHAGGDPPLALDDMLNLSAAVVVGKVEVVDKTNEGRLNAMTRVVVSVREVLHGEPTAQQLTLLIRGGALPGGVTRHYSIVRELEVGSTYALFLAGDYFITPLIHAADAVLKVEDGGAQEVVVDRAGQVVEASQRHGLVKTRPLRGAVQNGTNAARTASAGSLRSAPLVPTDTRPDVSPAASYANFRALLLERSAKLASPKSALPKAPKDDPSFGVTAAANVPSVPDSPARDAINEDLDPVTTAVMESP